LSPGSPHGSGNSSLRSPARPISSSYSPSICCKRDLYQKFASLYAAHGAATIERVCRKQHLSLANGMAPPELARCVEMAINGAKSLHPGMQPADAFVGDLTTMARTLVAGAVAPFPRSRPAKPAAKRPTPKKTVPKHSGDRK
jgi:TetR/AcrR family acrAB operon transcriptional repressor